VSNPWDLLYYYKARVVEVIDAETIVLDIDRGFGDWAMGTSRPGDMVPADYPQGVYRMHGIKATDRATDPTLFSEARSRVEELLALNAHREVVVRTHRTKDSTAVGYAVDLYVCVASETMCVNEQLVREGLAKARDR
jgi:endonuclease YncB( thermonuclease family)